MKVNIGLDQTKKKPFPISFDSSTTANFGECIPILGAEVPPNTHISLNIRDAVRFAPLSFPTFGKAFLKTYAFAHSIKDLYPPFDDLLARTPYTAVSGRQYLPTKVPTVPSYLLWLSVFSNCSFTLYSTVYNDVKDIATSEGSFTKIPLHYNPITSVSYIDSTNAVPQGLSNNDISASLVLWILSTLRQNTVHTLRDFTADFGEVDSYINYMMNSNSRDKIFFNNDASNLGALHLPFVSDEEPYVTPQSADYLFCLNDLQRIYFDMETKGALTGRQLPNGTWLKFEDSNGDSASNLFVAIRLNDSGKFLRKIFMGLGLNLKPSNTPISLLPIYAYFKSYFETFAPKRFVKFEQTYFYTFINTLVNTGLDAPSLICSLSDQFTNRVSWSNIIDDLLSCFYTKDTDYFSAQIVGMINDYGRSFSQKYIGESYNLDDGTSTTVDSIAGGNGFQANVDLSGENGSALLHTQAQQNILARLTQLLNRRSVLGGKIAEFLKSTFGISTQAIEDYNGYIGSSSLDVNFSDVFSTAETSEGSLGEYAGKALAFGDGDTFKFETKIHTIVVAFSVIIPRTQYVQGTHPYLTHSLAADFYNPMFDGLTLLPTRKSSFYSGENFFAFDDNNSSFGNIPIYSEYKTKTCGILNGDLSLRSTKSTYDSFTMDEIISDISQYEPDETEPWKGDMTILQYNPKYMVAGTMWRYLGRWLWLGRFDRIFVNNRLNFNDFLFSVDPMPGIDQGFNTTRRLGRSDDNLIVHHVVDMMLDSAMVPLSGSFMTDDLLALDKYGIKSSVE